MISGLCAAERGALDDDYIAMLAAMVLFAGHETTVVQIGIGAVLLLSNPSHRPAMLGDHDAMAAAVEEYLRVGHIGGGGVPRYARTDITVGDITIRAGELMVLDIGSANQDPDIYTAPGDVDPSRQPNPHLTFGHGSHYCLGAPLARVELQAVLPQLLRRFPTMHLSVPTEQLCWRSDQLTGGFAKIPVTW
jgi:pentalenolactone synthase